MPLLYSCGDSSKKWAWLLGALEMHRDCVRILGIQVRGFCSGPALIISVSCTSLNLSTASHEPWSKLLKGGYIRDYMGDYYRGY